VPFLSWIVLGLLAGSVAAKVENKKKTGVALDLPLGIVASVVGGLAFHTLGPPGSRGSDLYGLCVALACSVSVLAVYHALLRRA